MEETPSDVYVVPALGLTSWRFEPTREMPPKKDIFFVAFHGAQRSGKNTCAHILSTTQTKELAFADPLKQAAMALCEFSSDQVYDEKLKEEIDPAWGFTPRSFLQWLGTDVLRNQRQEDFLIVGARKRLLALRGSCEETGLRYVYITDCRFENEAQLIHSLGGVVVHVHRGPDKTDVDHASDKPLPPHLVNIHVYNDGSMSALRHVLIDMFRHVGGLTFC